VGRQLSRLKVTHANGEDVRHLLCRVDPELFAKLDITEDKYLDAVVVRLSSHGRRVRLIARTPVRPDETVGTNRIQLDEWSRVRLGTRVDEEVVVERAHLWDVVLYIWDAITKHPDISTRWQNVAVTFAVFGLLVAFPGVIFSVWFQDQGIFGTGQAAVRIVVTFMAALPLLAAFWLIRTSLPRW